MLKAFKKALGIEKKKTEAEPTFNVAEAGLRFVQKPEPDIGKVSNAN